MKIANGTWSEAGEVYDIHLDTLGIINGCVDAEVQEPSYPTFAYNNTYGIQAINQSVYQDTLNSFYEPGGVRDLIQQCRGNASLYDRTNQGNNPTVNDICVAASEGCDDIEAPYFDAGRGYYDIAHPDLDPFPPSWYVGFLNQPHVQRALGVPVNYTNPGGNGPYYAFQVTGDYARGGLLEDLSYILDNGIKVALVYGDRDYACNWIGGEAVSLAVNYSNSAAFASAGYADIEVNNTYVGGQVRQHGNLSFSRVFEAGHEVPAYQPETAYRIFMRALFNTDIATGTVNTATNGDYSTEGSSTTFQIKDEVPPVPQPTCYLYNFLASCTDDQVSAVEDGTALVHDWVVIDNNTIGLFPELSNGTTGGSGNGTVYGNGTGTYGAPSATSSLPASYTGGASTTRAMSSTWAGPALLVVLTLMA